MAESRLDVDSLRLEALEHLRRAIGFDMWCCPLVDPDSLVPHRPVVSDTMPFGAGLPRFLVQDQSADEINSRAVLARGRDRVCILSASTGGDLARCRRWREFAEPAGMGDELRAAVVDEHGCWASFELLRAGDAGLMRDAARILARSLRLGNVGPRAVHDVEAGQTGVLLMDGDLRPQGFTQAARDGFSVLGAREGAEHTPLPTHVYGVVGRLLAGEAGDDPARPPRVRVRTARRARSPSPSTGPPPRTCSRSSPAPTASPPASASWSRWCWRGSTRGSWPAGCSSPATPSRTLKSVFDKLGVGSRRELVTGVFGQAA